VQRLELDLRGAVQAERRRELPLLRRAVGHLPQDWVLDATPQLRRCNALQPQEILSIPAGPGAALGRACGARDPQTAGMFCMKQRSDRQ
jgi:hypothetical protein